ncbi:MAG: Holliday junction resolvase RecU [Clostridium sp.]
MAKSSTANRGLKFENEIQKKCDRLKDEGIALISKVPTEFKMIRRGAIITSAFPVSSSRFVDYVGIMNGSAIGIEAKETREEKRFPFANIKSTQIDFLNDWIKQGGKGYYIIRFEAHKRVFLIEASVMHDCIMNIGRKSAPFSWFEETKEVIELDYDKLNFEDYIK